MEHKNEVLKPHRGGKIDLLQTSTVNEAAISTTMHTTNAKATNPDTTTITGGSHKCDGTEFHVPEMYTIRRQ